MYTNSYPYNFMPQVQSQQQGASSNINWVQGEAGAKSFLVAPGQAVLLMDSESTVFYIKSSDASGMPMPLRTFDYTERVQKPETQSDFVTREEFDKFVAEMRDGKSTLPTA